MTHQADVDARLRPYVAGYLDVALDAPPTGWWRQRVSPPGGAGLTVRWSGDLVLFEGDSTQAVPPLHIHWAAVGRR